MIKLNISRFSLKLILSYLAIIILFILLISFFYYNNTKKLLENELFQANQYSLQQIASNINSNLKDFDNASYNLTVSSNIQAINNEEKNLKTLSIVDSNVNKLNIDKEIQRIIYNAIFTSDNIHHVYIYTKDGNVYDSGRTSGIPLSLSYKNLLSQCIQADEHFRNGKLFWTFDKISKQLSAFKVLISLASQKEFSILELRPGTNFIEEIINTPEYKKSYNIVLMDKKGNLLYQRNPSDFDYTILSNNILNLKGQEYFKSTINGSDSYVLHSHVSRTEWTLIMTIPIKEVSGSIMTSNKFLFSIGLITSIVCIIVSIFISIRISRPLRTLKKAMRKVECGNFDIQIGSLGNDEIGDLGKSFNQMILRLKKLIDEIYVQKLITKESELEALQAQINPHFIYNTLESINCLAEIKGVKEISKMVKTLAQLLRSCISDKKEYVSIENEIENIESYIYLQNVRFGGKIIANIECLDSLKNAKIPKLILQPIVENAILHGLEQKIGSGFLKININQVGKNIIIIIKDDGVGFDKNKVEFKNTGLGIKNVDRRIKILFGEEYGMSFESQIGKGTNIEVLLPYIESKEE